MDDTNKKIAFNVGGALLGVILASVAIFGLVAVKASATQPQKYTTTSVYDGSN